MALTGYRITEFIDVNPNSPTYNQTRQERTADSGCSPVAANWVELTSFCELDEHGKVTGYYIHVQVDQAEGSDTYGETREVKETAASGQCVDANDNPNWIIDPYYNSYCETKTYEPSMVVGDTGRFITRIIDDNVYSPTYNTAVESAFTESDWIFSDPFPCETPNTSPIIEELSAACELVNGENDGYIIINGIDKNPYSSTYLSTLTVREENLTRCPVAASYIFQWSDGTSAKTIMHDYTQIEISLMLKSFSGSNRCDFTIQSSSNWLTATKAEISSGDNNYVLNLSASTNTATLPRVGDLTLVQADSNNQITVEVDQDGMQEFIINCTITSTSSRYVVEVNSVQGDASMFTEAEKGKYIGIQPISTSTDPTCQHLATEDFLVGDLIELVAGDKLWNETGINMCIFNGLNIDYLDSGVNDKLKIVARQSS